MKIIILIVLVCLSIAACNSSSPEAIEKQKFKAIEKEQQRDREEFARFVERNPNVVPRYEPENNNRQITGDEQREIYNRAASGQSPKEISRAKSSDNNGNGGVSDNEPNYSIKFPDGWKVERVNAFGNDGIQATSKKGSQIIVAAKKQDTSNIAFTDEFAEYFAKNATYPMLKQGCNNVSIVKAYATHKGHDAINNVMLCDGQNIDTKMSVANGVTYTLTVVYNSKDDPEGYNEMPNSLKTYKIGD
jgi:hypothetical protein